MYILVFLFPLVYASKINFEAQICNGLSPEKKLLNLKSTDTKWSKRLNINLVFF